MASSTKFKTFAITFAIVGPVIYMICLYFNWPLFTFHPATNRIAFGLEAAQERRRTEHDLVRLDRDDDFARCGVLSYLATLLPENVTKKLPLTVVWLLPILAIPVADLGSQAMVVPSLGGSPDHHKRRGGQTVCAATIVLAQSGRSGAVARK